MQITVPRGQKLRVLFVHNFYKQSGGEDAVVRQEIALLRRMGHDVAIYSVHNDDIRTLLDKIRVFWRTTYNRAQKKNLQRAIARHRPDIVHVHNFFPQLSPSIFDACQDARVPCVMTLHNFRILCPTAFLYHDEKVRERSLTHSCWWTVPLRVYRGSLLGTFAVARMVEHHKRIGTWNRKVNKFIALTEFAVDKFVEGGISRDLFAIKGNALLEQVATPPESCPRHGALFVGRLSEEKGIRNLLSAWKSLSYPLKIVGDGPLAAEVAAANVPSVSSLGRLAPELVGSEMENAAFLVLPSTWYEMFPMVIPEAFSRGLPVVVSRLPGLSSLIEEGVTGLSFDPRCPEDLRTKVEWAIQHPAEMASMGSNARQRYLTHYTPQANYEKLVAIYQDVVGAIGHPPN